MSALTLQVLQETRQILTESTWAKNALARNRYGHPCDPIHTGAQCFCLAGAIDRAIYNLMLPNFAIVRQHAVRHLKQSAKINGLLGEWNDKQLSFDSIIAAIDCAIECLAA